MKIYIPTNYFEKLVDRRELSPLVRPFFAEGQFVTEMKLQLYWGIRSLRFTVCNSLAQAELVLLPMPLQHYVDQHMDWLKDLNDQCALNKILTYAFISGDFGEKYVDFKNVNYFRLGGFASKLSNQNKGFPFMLSDHLQRLFETEDIAEIAWDRKPIVGFCGHASSSILKANKEKLKFVLENLRRFFHNPFRMDYEPLFASAYERWKLLQSLEQNTKIQTNIIYRKHYRAGAKTQNQREQSTLEYYKNLRNSAYVLCVRGGGNFSVRLYETLMMGRIPVFINTDCLIPFPEIIPWKEHMVWVEWKDRHRIVEKILEFHFALSPEQFTQLQQRNRQLWKEKLTLGGILENLSTNLS